MQRQPLNNNQFKEETTKNTLSIQDMPNEIVYQILSYLSDHDINQTARSTKFLNVRTYEYLSSIQEAMSPEQLTALLAQTNNVTTIDPISVIKAIRYWDVKERNYQRHFLKKGPVSNLNNFINMKITLAIILFHLFNQCDDKNYKILLDELNEKIKLIYNDVAMTLYQLFFIKEKDASSKTRLLQRLIDVFVHNLKRRDELFKNDNKKLPVHLNLSGINLSGQYLPDIKLSNTNLSYANLENANLRGATLIDTILNETNLSNVNLKHAIITHFKNFDFTKINIFATYPMTPAQWYVPHLLPQSVFNTNSNNALTNALNEIYKNQILTLDKDERKRVQGYMRRFLALYIIHSIKDKDNESALAFIDEMKKSKLFQPLFKHRTIKKFKLKLFNEIIDHQNVECIKDVEKFIADRNPKKELK